jgi:hypothetical protein
MTCLRMLAFPGARWSIPPTWRPNLMTGHSGDGGSEESAQLLPESPRG